MTLAIMQPYFLPYMGYWQLMALADRFVVYDNIQYTKRGWINRNRFLRAGADAYFTVPLKKDSDHLNVADREVADNYDRSKLLRSLEAAYRRAPYFATAFPVVERVVQCPLRNLFEYVHHSLVVMADALEIRTPLILSSTIPIDHSLTSGRRVLALCKAMGADRYVNPIGGRDLYSKVDFDANAVRLEFLRPRSIEYPQFGGSFVPNLSIVDVLMFNSTAAVRAMLDRYDVVPAL